MVGVRGEASVLPVQAAAVSAITPPMITAFRRYSETWVVRGFFLIMVLAFMLWGVGDVVRLIGTSTWVAKVGGETIEGAQLQQAYQRGMAQATRNLPQGQEPTQPMRDAVALCAACDALVSPDTGMTHVATAFSRPMVVLMQRDNWMWGPYKVPSRVLTATDRASLDSISVDAVSDAVDSLLGEIGAA